MKEIERQAVKALELSTSTLSVQSPSISLCSAWDLLALLEIYTSRSRWNQPFNGGLLGLLLKLYPRRLATRELL